jgi:outer membrane protein OmpA-like peptidoglycan-associated protein
MIRRIRPSTPPASGDEIWGPAADLMSGLLLVFMFLVMATILQNNESQSAIEQVTAQTASADQARETAELRARELAGWRDVALSILGNGQDSEDSDGELRRQIAERLQLLLQRDRDARELVIQLAAARVRIATLAMRHRVAEAQLLSANAEVQRLHGMLGGDASFTQTRANLEARIDQLAGQFGGGELRRAPGVLAISAELLFGTNEAQLTPAGEAELNRIIPSVATTLLSRPEDAAIVHRIIIEGHASCRGGALHNMRLSVLRAQAVYRHIRGSMETLPHRDAFFARLAPTGRGSIECSTAADDDPADRRVDIRVEFSSATLPAAIPATGLQGGRR